MRKMLNVLYVTNPDSYLIKDGETVVIRVNEQKIARVPLINLEGIVCFGYMGMSPQLMGACADRGIGVSFLTPSGRFLARVSGYVSGNVLLRKRQYALSEDEFASAEIAIACVLGKIINERTVLNRFRRDHNDQVTDVFQENIDRITEVIEKVKNSETCDLGVIRGYEGFATKYYFNCFDSLILADSEEFAFEVRSKRPPLNRVNAMLSFIYSLISHDVRSALETVGLDPQVGFLHRDRPGRVSLALDLMEELRPYLGDRLVLTLINNRTMNSADFTVKENGAVLLNDAGRKKVLSEWQMRKKDHVLHPYLNEKIPVGLIPYAQAMIFARFIRGDIDGYPPFIMR